MTQKFILSTVILFLSIFTATSQTNDKIIFTVKGVVTDSISNETIPFCTVSASSVKSPRVYLKRTTADNNGKFSLELNKKDTIIISFDAVGMKQGRKVISLADQTTIDMGTVLLQPDEKMLAGVTVTATKPLVKVDLDKISYDTKSDPESMTSNAFDMLKKVPMVTVDSDDKIQVKGKTNFKIFINGKPSNLTSGDPSAILKSMPATTIKNIEVITQPGAKYEAEGLSGIINIVTEKAVGGYMASLSAGVDNFGGYNGGAYFTTKVGKFGISTNLNYGNYRRPEVTNTSLRASKLQPDTLFQTGTSSNTGANQYGNVEMSYEVDSLNLITLSGSGWGGKFGGNGKNLSYQRINGVENQRYTSDYNSIGSYGGYDMNLNYQKSYMKPDKLFTLSYQLSMSPNGNDNTTNIIGLKNYMTRKQHLVSNSEGTEHTFQLDYVEPFNKKHVVDFGVKYIVRINNSANDYTYLDTLVNQWKPIPNMADNDMMQNQHILGAYSDYTLKLNKFSVRAGLRLEHTSTKIDFKNDPSLNFEVPPFTNLVPSLRLNYKLTDMMTMQLGYNQRISRPGIWYLNPFLNNTDPAFVSQGNPNLKTEIDNSFDLNYSYFTPKFNMNASLSTSFTNNSIERTSELRKYDNGQTYQYSTYQNIGMSNINSLYTYMRWQATKQLSLNFNGSLTYSVFKTGLEDIGNRDGFQYRFFAGGNYKFPKDFTLNFNGGYSSPSVALQGKYSPWYYYNLSVTKSFLEKKLNISLGTNSFLEKYRNQTSYTETAAFRTDNKYSYPARSFRLSVSYRFGEMKAQIKTAKRSIKNDDVKSGGSSESSGGGTTGSGSGGGN